MKRVITCSSTVPWNYFNKFEEINDKYLPRRGQGDTMATQIVTVANKLVYKFYNDGDVFDNTKYLEGWANDLSDYANWLYEHVDETIPILDGVYECTTEAEYSYLLRDLCDLVLDAGFLSEYSTAPAQGDVYECSGPFEFVDRYVQDEDDDVDYDDDIYDDEYEY